MDKSRKLVRALLCQFRYLLNRRFQTKHRESSAPSSRFRLACTLSTRKSNQVFSASNAATSESRDLLLFGGEGRCEQRRLSRCESVTGGKDLPLQECSLLDALRDVVAQTGDIDFSPLVTLSENNEGDSVIQPSVESIRGVLDEIQTMSLLEDNISVLLMDVEGIAYTIDNFVSQTFGLGMIHCIISLISTIVSVVFARQVMFCLLCFVINLITKTLFPKVDLECIEKLLRCSSPLSLACSEECFSLLASGSAPAIRLATSDAVP
jgi:hypothetical protein